MKISAREIMELWVQLSGNKGSDKLDAYFEELERIFFNFEDKPLRVLEIGTQRGGNLVFLSEFLPMNSIVVGVDIHEPLLPLPENVIFIKGDSTRLTTLSQVEKFGPFDLIVEDASHIQKDVIANVKIYAPLLSDNGFMMIEDTQYGIINGWGRGYKGRRSFASHYINNMYPDLLFPKVGQESFNAYFAPYSVTISRSKIHEINRVDSKLKKRTYMTRPSSLEVIKKWIYLKYEQRKPRILFPFLKFLYKTREFNRRSLE